MAAAVAVTFFGFSFLIFRSGSMAPEITTGSLALAHTVPATEIREGDVVSVLTLTGERITHRVITSTIRDDGAALVLQGDANGAPDEEIYLVSEAEREIFSVPYLGYLVSVLLSPAGAVAVVCFALMLVLAGFNGQSRTTPSSGPRRGRASHRAPRRGNTWVKVTASFSTVLIGVLGVGGSATAAAFSDDATLNLGTFSAVTLSPPTNVRCVPAGSGNNDSYIAWDAPTGVAPTGYQVSYLGSGNNPPFGSVLVTSTPRIYRPPTSVLSSRTFTVSVASRVGNWQSVPSGTTSITVTSVALIFTFRC